MNDTTTGKEPAQTRAIEPRSGSVNALTDSTRSLRDRLVRLAYRFLWNLEDAEDVAHDALVTGGERGCDLRDQGKRWSWLSRIVVNRCFEQKRRKKMRERHSPILQTEVGRRRRAAAQPVETDRTSWLVPLLRRLPRRQQEVIVLRHLQGMSFAEIAGLLGMEPSTARVHAREGRESLRRLILECCPERFEAVDLPKGRPVDHKGQGHGL